MDYKCPRLGPWLTLTLICGSKGLSTKYYGHKRNREVVCQTLLAFSKSFSVFFFGSFLGSGSFLATKSQNTHNNTIVPSRSLVSMRGVLEQFNAASFVTG